MTEDSWTTLAFYALAIGMVGMALAVVGLPRIVHSALALVAFFVGIAGLYVLLGAEFIAAVQVIIYVGAVTVLFLFAIMLTQHSQTDQSNPTNRQWLPAAVVALGVLVVLVVALGGTAWGSGGGVTADAVGKIGGLMLGQFVLPFEVAAGVLLVALIGAIVIAREA